MNAVEVLRAAHARTIAENPVEVAIRRLAFVDGGNGGREKQETFLAPFSGRLVMASSSRGVTKATSEAGLVQTGTMSLLAPWDADVRAGSDVEDTFEAAGRRYRVSRVIPRAYQGEVYGLQALLEEVG